MMMLNYLLITISLLISVAFYTLLERKILSYIQMRKGPNKVGLLGMMQPFSDAIKLFNKTLITLESMNYMMSLSTPATAMLLAILIIPMLIYNNIPLYDNKHNMLLFFIISSMMVYSMMMIGWSANSKFSSMGSIRSVAQMLSYEVSFFLIIMLMSIMSYSYSFKEMILSQNMIYYFWGNMMLLFMWLTSCLAETNRSPFDFAEGESELVSGFNVEYMGGLFALIFLAEYLSMIILSMMTSIMFFSLNKMLSFIILMMIMIMMLWIRGTMPRFRYDMLMTLSWKIFLPSILLIIPLYMLITMYNI